MKQSTPDLTYKQHGYVIIEDFLPSILVNYFNVYLNTLKKVNKLEKDRQCNHAEYVYGDPAFDTLLIMTAPLVSKIIGISLVPTYSYARIYYKGSKLRPHWDRDECEHSVSINLEQSSTDSWPIYMHDKIKGQTSSCNLNKGDAIIYKGSELIHWRDPLEADSHSQLFLHFVDAKGVHVDKIFDSRSYPGAPFSELINNYELSRSKQQSQGTLQ